MIRKLPHSNEVSFTKDIMDGMLDWVRVLDRDNNIIYANKAMREGLKDNPVGRKCYEILGKDDYCENCVSRKSVFDGSTHEKTEIINGRIFSVMSSPVKNDSGEIIAVVEVLRDVTDNHKMNVKIESQNKKLSKDLDMARKIQTKMLPAGLNDNNIGFGYIYQPCEALGGDFVDIFYINENKIGMYIADVQGHGVPASLLTIFVKFSFDKREESPSKALNKLFMEFNSNRFDTAQYITIFYAVVDLKNGEMKYANAGHNVSPILYSQNRFEILRSPGIPISNWLENPNYSDRIITVNAGDRFFLYTDGLLEITNPSKKQFGEEKVLECLTVGDQDINSILANIIHEVVMFSQLGNLENMNDDITLALLEIKSLQNGMAPEGNCKTGCEQTKTI